MNNTVRLALLTAMTLLAQTLSAGTDPMTSKLDSLFQEFAEPDAPGASVIVIHKGKVLFAKAYGLADVEAGVPCSTNTNFRLASVSKQFTAMAVLILAERKKLSLDERLTDFFPEFPEYGTRITVRHLLNHTSGLIDYESVIPKGTTIPVLDQDVLRLLLAQDKTYFPPGTQYRYSNSAYALLALIVETRSGNTFARFLRENIFHPLGMRNTIAYEQGISSVPNRAFGYTLRSNRCERTDQSLTSSVLGDGGIYSSVSDLFKWDQALYGSKLVSRRLLQQAFTPGTGTDKPETGYGFGWYISEHRGIKEVWHSGETCGFTTRLARFPEKKFTVIVLTNRRNAAIDTLPHRIADLYL
jgi:CubicO group peptidase (beta-lactamase class C family)